MFNIKYISYLIVFNVLIACSSEQDVASVVAGTGSSSRLSELLRDDGGEAFPRALEVRAFAFPEDHNAHEDYRNEWWYFTGNLDAPTGERFGYELTIFRFSLTAGDQRQTGSAWQSNQVYIGHFAVTDVDEDRFHVAQRYSRGAAGLAGNRMSPFAVWLEDWRIDSDGQGFPWRLRAADGDLSLELELEPVKPIVLNGDRGLSQKSAEPGNASYYYSIPRLSTRGNLVVEGRDYAVTGLSWLDREWGSSALAPDQAGWDWFSLQLSDGSDLMFYTLRNLSGEIDPQSAGTWIAADGTAESLRLDEISITVNRYWQSDRGGQYPGGWDIEIPGKQLRLSISPVVEDQELMTNVRYWEGAVDVSGERDGRPISGRGYVELTGYAR